MAERLTMTSDRGGLAFTFALDITCKPSEMRKIIALGERLKAYEDTGKEPEDVTLMQSVMEQDHIRLKELESENASLRARPENKPLTNSDRFRRMSDEEIAKILVSDLIGEKIPFCKNKPECDSILDSGECIPESMCAVCAIDWLRKECHK